MPRNDGFPLAKAAVLWTVLLAAACSSAPPAPEGIHDRKDQAADSLKFGQKAFLAAKYEQALSFFQIAVDLDTAVDDAAGMAVSWNSLATAQTALGRTDDARASLAQAEMYAAAAKDRRLILQVAVNLVQADLAAEDRAEARRRLTKLQPFPDTAEGAALDHALGLLEKSENHPAEALAAFDRAFSVNQRLNLKEEMASNRFMKASILSQQGKAAEALTELQEALVLDRMMENSLGIGQDWRALGTLALKRGDNLAAFDDWVRASRLFQAAGLTAQQKKTLELLLPLTVTLNLPEETARYRGILDRLNSSK